MSAFAELSGFCCWLWLAIIFVLVKMPRRPRSPGPEEIDTYPATRPTSPDLSHRRGVVENLHEVVELLERDNASLETLVDQLRHENEEFRIQIFNQDDLHDKLMSSNIRMASMIERMRRDRTTTGLQADMFMTGWVANVTCDEAKQSCSNIDCLNCNSLWWFCAANKTLTRLACECEKCKHLRIPKS